MKKRLADIVFKEINPPDYKTALTGNDLAEILVQRLGLQRKASRAKHAELLLYLLDKRKQEVPVTIEEISKVLGVSQSQTYEEIRKWRTLSLLEFMRVPLKTGDGFMKGYMLPGATVNQLVDKAASSANAFIRRTKRIAKDFDDQLSAGAARSFKK